MGEIDAAAKQLEDWKTKNEDKIGYASNSAGIGIVDPKTSLTIGEKGLIPLRDWQMIEHISHFHRERIPERIVHAKGAGAFGYFECTKELTQYTSSKVFETVGKETQIAVRFSTVAGNMGSADTVRDPRGFALKFYTEEGIWDLVGNNTPIFFMRDPILFPMFIHSQKRNPVTNMRDWDAFWDYLSLTPMSVHQVMILFSDRGIPKGHRHQHGYGANTFSFINKDRKLTWCKFIYKTDQGIENFEDPAEAERVAGADPDYAIRDLYNAIADADGYLKKYPSWTFYVQLMTPEQAKQQKFDPFDITKNNFQRDGLMCIYNQGGAPNYYPNSFGGPGADPFASKWTPPTMYFEGYENYYPQYYEEDNYSQPKVFWEKVLDEGAKSRLVNNLAGSIKLANKDIQNRTVDVFSCVSEDLGNRLKHLLFGETKIVHL
ncbi:hypothetical protein ABEB36_013447 [Hypothenemus hampei]|uniref:Catalase core domain-containing protein n=1 Tax=Hypothenemus hampei TaxID=57062 RepID=A0ABD1E8Z2_HYPHA